MRRTSLVVSLLLALPLSGATAPLEAKGNSPPVMTARTIDGSMLTGVVRTAAVELVTPYARIPLPMGCVRSAILDPDVGVFRIVASNGDRLSGTVESESVTLDAAIGELTLPWKHITELLVPETAPSPDDLGYRPTLTSFPRFEISLRDGSLLLGTPDRNQATVYGEFGRVELPWGFVRHVTFHEDRETCTLDLWQGDVLVGCVNWKACSIATGCGSVQVSTVTTKEIALSLGGTDLVSTPYAAADGNKWFLGGLKAIRERTIRGRVHPASSFLEAHASGRIEYTFDAPIREFRAVATMYATYSATKGSVVFRVETEDGRVYDSGRIRNFGEEEIYIRFPPSRKLVLITDSVGSADEDWSVWLYPEVR